MSERPAKATIQPGEQTDAFPSRLAEQLKIIEEISRLISAEEAPENIVRTTLVHLTDTLHYQAAQVYRLSASGKNLWLYLESGFGLKPVTSNLDIFSIDEDNIICQAAKTGTPVYIPNIQKGPYSYFQPDSSQLHIRSEIALPMQCRGQGLGVLRIQSSKLDGFDPIDVNFLSSLTGLLAGAIKNAQTIRRLQDNLEEIKILYNLRRKEDFRRHVHSDTAFHLGFEYHQDKLTVVEVDELPPAARRAISDEQVGVINIQEGQHTELVAPIKLYGETIGVLGVEDMVNDAGWTTDDVSLLEEVSNQVALAIENARLLEQAQTRTQELSLLFDTTRQFIETIDLHQIYNIVAVRLLEYLDADCGRVLLLNDSRTHIQQIVGKCREPGSGRIIDDMKQAPLIEAVEDNPTLQTMLRTPDVIVEYVEPPTHSQELATQTSFPLIVRKNLVGIVRIRHEQTRRQYTENELQLARAIIAQATVAIENARLFEQTEQALNETQRLYEISRALVESAGIEDIFKVVLDTVKTYGVDRVSISLLEEDPNTHLEKVKIVASWDRHSDKIFPVGSEVSAAQFPLVKTFAQPPFHPLISEDLTRPDQQDPRMDENFRRFMVDRLKAVTLFSAPLFLGAEYKGVLSISTRTPHTYTPTEKRVYQTLADQAIIAIERQRLLEATQQERDRAEQALAETELLYNAIREFTTARSVDDLLLTLVRSFALPEPYGIGGEIASKDINHMSIGLITAWAEDGTPEEMEFIASWNSPAASQRRKTSTRELIRVTHPDLRISAAEFPCLKNLSQVSVVQIAPHTPEAGCPADQMGAPLGESQTVLAAPLTAGNNWLGFLFVGSHNREFAIPANVSQQILTLAGQVAVVLQNLRLLEDTQKNLFYEEIQSRLSQELMLADTREAIYQECLNAIAATDPERGAAIFMYEPIEDSVNFNLVAIWNNPTKQWPDVVPGSRYSAEQLGLTALLKTGQTITSTDITQDDAFSEQVRQLMALMQIRGMVAVPLWLNKEVNGFILIASDKPTVFSSDVIRLYENIGRRVSNALENRRLFEELEYRAQQLQTAAEVSQAATGYLDLDTLLTRSVNLVRDRFGFYHASIFLVDEYQKYAVIAASTGAVGQKMLEMRHKLAVGGKSIVGTATATGQPHIALDVGKDAVHFNNPLLPDTRSEMALPLIARGRVIGALDVQSVKPVAFSDSDIAILQSMANQLANAIEAARSFEEARKALEDVRRLQERHLRETWSSYLEAQQTPGGYALTPTGIAPLDETEYTILRQNEFVQQALHKKQPIITDPALLSTEQSQNGKHKVQKPTTEEEEERALIAPLTLYGDVAIGAVELEALAEELQDEDTLKIVEAVVTQAAQAIEAARLFEQTQIAREEAEALYRVGRALATAETQDEMFTTVLRETLGALGLKQGGILLFDPDRKTGRLHALFREGHPVTAGQVIPIEGNPSYEKLLRTGQPVAINDFATDPLVASVRDLNLGWDIASLLLVPLRVGDEVIGAIGADSVEHRHPFTDNEINLVVAMADQLSMALQNQQLLEETRLRAKQLEETAQRLQELDRLKTQFLANMSHELRTPLNSIIGFSRVILKGIDGPLTELQKTDLTSIYNSGQHLLSLINNILDISKIEAGKMELYFEDVELVPIIKSVMSTAIALVKEKPVELLHDVPEDLPTIWADATRIRQVILNLVSNACKFTDEGTITLKARADKEKVIVSVSDTGIGIPPDKLEHIFEEFTQVDASTTRKAGGTGLGLPICRHFVEMHQGQIWVESTPGKGSTFTFAIPIKPMVEEEVSGDGSQAAEHNTGQDEKTVVVIDNDSGMVKLYRRFLEKRSYRIIEISAQADDITAQVKTHTPDVILLEPLIPDIDGWKLLKALKQEAVTRDIPVIICSLSSDRNRSVSLGAAEHLTKPIIESELVNTLKQIFNREKEQTRVLVIDDHADDILLIRRILEAQNYAVSEAVSGKDGLEIIKARPPDLVILDLTMPEIDGFAVIKTLKETPKTRHIPIVVVSARAISPIEQDLLSNQVEVVLHKSAFSEQELLEAIRQSLHRTEKKLVNR